MFKDIKSKILFCILPFSLISLFHAMFFLLVKKRTTHFCLIHKYVYTQVYLYTH